MFHAPVPIDADRTSEAPATKAAEAIGFDAGNERLREAHLHNGQVEARALFAPFFAITAVAAALIVAWAMFGSVEPELVVGWVAAGRLRQLGLLPPRDGGRRAAAAAAPRAPRAAMVRRSPRRSGSPALWSALPDLCLRHPAAPRPGRDRRRDGGDDRRRDRARRHPGRRDRLDRDADRAPSASLIISAAARSIPSSRSPSCCVAGVGAFGVARLTRWIFGQLQGLAETRAQAESIRQLLNEYEHRGVGWLWQVDAENRVVYISSRMTALLGRSTNQLIGHSLPAALGGTSALGRTLLVAPALRQSRDGAEDPARHALDQPVGRSDHRHGRPVPGLPRRRPGRDRGPPHPGAADQPRQYGRAFGPAQSRPRPPAARRGAVRLGRRRDALRDHVPRSRRLQAGQRHVRPPEGRRGAEERRAAPGQGSRAVRPCRPDGRRRIRHRHQGRAEPRAWSRRSPSG